MCSQVSGSRRPALLEPRTPWRQNAVYRTDCVEDAFSSNTVAEQHHECARGICVPRYASFRLRLTNWCLFPKL
jgi:hypothetical protein